jgi:hypothetical protein
MQSQLMLNRRHTQPDYAVSEVTAAPVFVQPNTIFTVLQSYIEVWRVACITYHLEPVMGNVW